jgi:hypothetical protein
LSIRSRHQLSMQHMSCATGVPSCLTATHGDGVCTGSAAQASEPLDRPRTSMGVLRQGSVPGKALSDRQFPRWKSYGGPIRISPKPSGAMAASPPPQLAPFPKENRPRIMRATRARDFTETSPLLAEANAQRLPPNQGPFLLYNRISFVPADQAGWGRRNADRHAPRLRS